MSVEGKCVFTVVFDDQMVQASARCDESFCVVIVIYLLFLLLLGRLKPLVRASPLGGCRLPKVVGVVQQDLGLGDGLAVGVVRPCGCVSWWCKAWNATTQDIGFALEHQ